MQCLIDIDGLGKFFLNEEISQDILTSLRKGKQKRLSFAIQRLFFHAILEKDKTYKPQSILGVLKEKNFIFKRENSEINPIICLIFMLNELHDELNWKKRIKNFKNVNKYNCQEVIQNSIFNYENSNDSIISNTFTIYCLKEINCTNCRKRSYLFHNYITFDLDILGYFNQSKKNRIRIYDCLDFATQKKVIPNIYCESCTSINQAESLLSIINTPERLIFMIDRGDFDKNLMDLNFYIETEISLEPYMTYKKSNVKYELRGIVSIFQNKYISFVKSENNFWCLFNDSIVQKIEDFDFMNTNHGLKHVPCILFYQLIKK